MVITNYLLEINVCIHLLRNNIPSVTTRFAAAGAAACCISEITVAELRVGAESIARPQHHHLLVDKLTSALRVLPIAPAIRLFARERVRLQKNGQPIDSFDLLIGATALANDLTMVTNNRKHFARLRGLKIEDWAQAL